MTKLRKRRKTKGMMDHQSRKTMIRAKAQIRNREFARKNGTNLKNNKIIIQILRQNYINVPKCTKIYLNRRLSESLYVLQEVSYSRNKG